MRALSVRGGGERGKRIITAALLTPSGQELRVTAVWDEPDGTPRRLSEIAEELRGKAHAAAGASPEPEVPWLQVARPLNSRP